jgi:chemotaxis protein MotB
VSDALLGFEGKGLTVHMKNGKVYVSMDEKLLFASGKWEVSSDGSSALRDLAKVLMKNPDINVLIEGHTDNVPYTGTGQVKDNWDLSVMRATAIVKILLANSKIDPKRFTTAGRSEYLPVDASNSTAARAKNRRTEIILSPKLDELLQIIGNN